MSPREPKLSRPIWVIEDDGDVREALAAALECEGYQVVAVPNGHEALLLARDGAFRPSLILLDLTMPVMDGAQFRTQQRLDPQLAEVPVVILSAAREGEVRHRDLDPAAYLRKPSDLATLLATIERCAAGAEDAPLGSVREVTSSEQD